MGLLTKPFWIIYQMDHGHIVMDAQGQCTVCCYSMPFCSRCDKDYVGPISTTCSCHNPELVYKCGKESVIIKNGKCLQYASVPF